MGERDPDSPSRLKRPTQGLGNELRDGPRDGLRRGLRMGLRMGLRRGLRGAFRRPSGSATSIREVVADVHGVERFRWIERNTLAFSLAVHTLFLAAFLLLHLWWLAGLNVASIATYVIALRLLRRGGLTVPYRLGAIEVVTHAAVATVLLGAASGFFIYLPLVAVMALWHPLTSRRTKVLWAAAVTLASLALVALGEARAPMMPLADTPLGALAVMNMLLFMLGLSFLAHVSNEATRAAEGDLRAALGRLDELARTDSLTGLLNRRAIGELLDGEAARVGRTGRRFAVMVADLDDFKLINDAHGHPVGDHVLRCIANRLLGAIRAQDHVARWGGEEFLLLLPETDLDTAAQVADRLRAAVSAPAVRIDGIELSVTTTIGVAAFEPGGSVLDTIRAADRALYAGKGLGKDRVVPGKS